MREKKKKEKPLQIPKVEWSELGQICCVKWRMGASALYGQRTKTWGWVKREKDGSGSGLRSHKKQLGAANRRLGSWG